MRIAVVGAGTAGAAAAIFLSRAGHDVTVFERVPEPGPVGAGIMMQPSGLLVLERLGLAERVIARGSQVEHLVCERAGGKRVLDLRYDALDEGLFGVGLHRGVLFETLFGALRASDARVRCGVAIDRVRRAKRDESHRVVLVDDGGEAHGPFDLLLVCDGARSGVRDSMHAMARDVKTYPWGALWFIGKDPDELCAGRLHQTVRGAKKMIGLLPSGIGPEGGTVPLVSLFVSTRAEDLDAIRDRGIDALKLEIEEIAPHAEHVLDQITDMGALTYASYFDVTMPRWHAHRVALLGDAAHATSPQLGQGCNLALCDAAALHDAIAHATESGHSLEHALAIYTASRRDHLAYYQLATRWLTPFFQSDHDVLGAIRDWMMGPASKLGFVRREMVRSMAGTKTGLLWGSMETRMPRG